MVTAAHSTLEGVRALAVAGAAVSAGVTEEESDTIRVAIAPEVYCDDVLERLMTIEAPVALTLYSGVTISDHSCRRLATFQHLSGLDLPESGASTNGLAALGNSPHLRHLALCDRDLRLFDLDTFSCLSALTSLRLDRSVLAPNQWSKIAKISGLSEFSCDGVALSAEAWSALKHLSHLKSLRIGGAWMAQADFEQLGALDCLECVTVSDTWITGDRLMPLVNLPHLRVLDLSGAKLEDRCLRTVADCKHLRELNLSDTEICGQHADELTRLSHLEKLNLSDTRIDDDCLKRLAGLRGLRSLSIERCPCISDEGILELGVLDGLTRLCISNSQLTDRAMAIASKMPELITLVARGNNTSALGITSLKNCDRLSELRLSYHRLGHPEQFVTDVMEGVACLGGLRTLEVSGLQQSEGALRNLAKLTHLETLTLCNSGLDDNSIRAVALLGSLRRLDVRFNNLLADNAVDTILQLNKLEAISVSFCGMSRDAIARLGKRVVVNKPEGTITIR